MFVKTKFLLKPVWEFCCLTWCFKNVHWWRNSFDKKVKAAKGPFTKQCKLFYKKQHFVGFLEYYVNTQIIRIKGIPNKIYFKRLKEKVSILRIKYRMSHERPWIDELDELGYPFCIPETCPLQFSTT